VVVIFLGRTVIKGVIKREGNFDGGFERLGCVVKINN
jgi:hypothetical protein